MTSFKLIQCYIKFQLCVGFFPDGRMRTRTFGIKNIRPDLSADDIAAVARAIAPLLDYPVVRVRLVRRYGVGMETIASAPSFARPPVNENMIYSSQKRGSCEGRANVSMITNLQINVINYIVACINDFAARHTMDARSAYRFLTQFGGIAFLMQHYEIEHTLDLDDAIDDLETICRQNGGIFHGYK